MEIIIPGYGDYKIENIVFDFNGTIAEGGEVKAGNLECLEKLTEDFGVYVITADTFGGVRGMFESSRVQVKIISPDSGAMDKKRFVEELGKENTIAVGNGFNDRLMLEAATLGFCIVGPEGASAKALAGSDVVLNKIEDFFKMMDEPKRLVATLRG